jgi:hypothetical protein
MHFTAVGAAQAAVPLGKSGERRRVVINSKLPVSGQQ